jgi:hypothetical protein
MFDFADTAIAALGRAWAVTMIALAALTAMTVLSQVDAAIYCENLEASLIHSE